MESSLEAKREGKEQNNSASTTPLENILKKKAPLPPTQDSSIFSLEDNSK